MSSLIDVAKLAGVSPSTISRYIRNACNVSDDKKERIKSAIAQLGYVPNINASILKSNRSNLVGLLLPGEHNMFFSLLINRLYQSMTGKQIIVLYYKDSKHVKEGVQTLLSLKVSAILFIPVKHSDTITNMAGNSDCYFLQLFVDSFPQFDSLTINDNLGTYLATKELLDAGHRSILLIDKNNDVFDERLKGYKRAFSDSGLAFDPQNVLSLHADSELSAALMERWQENRPTAMIAVTEVLSQECCRILQENRISIPDDVSFITYDDSKWAKLCRYTAVCQPLEEVVSTINRLVTKAETKSQESPEKIVIDPIIIERQSVKKNEEL